MQHTLEYIEDYFTQALSSEERTAFETRCQSDEDFAREVAFYLTARSAARELLAEQKQSLVTERETVPPAAKPAVPVRTIMLRKWLPYAAAACILFVAIVYFLFAPPKSQQLANRYIKEKYATLGTLMDASRDSMQLGINAYNNKDYKRAQALFDGVRKNKPEISDAKKYAGLAYLQTKNYDQALECFGALAAMNIKYNSGDMLSAATLLQRNNAGDKEKAKQLLQKVADKNEEGSGQASEWLEKLGE